MPLISLKLLIRSGAIDVIVLSIQLLHLVSRQELDGQMGDTTVGLASTDDESSYETAYSCNIQDQLRLYFH
jgi:RecA/RadA recombinase